MAFQWSATISLNLKCLRLVALMPKPGYGGDFYSVYAAGLVLTTWGFLALEGVLWWKLTVFSEWVELLLFMSSLFICFIKMLMFIRSGGQLKALFVALDGALFQPTQGQVALVHSDLGTWANLYRFLFGGACLTGVIVLFLPFITGSWRSFRLPIPVWCLFGCGQGLEYALMYIFACVVIMVAIVAGFNMDMFFAAQMVFIGAQCDILSNNLVQLEMHSFEKQLIVSIRHYKEIMDFVKIYNNFCNLSFLGQFLISMVNVSMTLFQLSSSQPNTISFYANFGVVMVIITQMFSYCFFGNQVLSKSAEIAYSTFKSPWMRQPVYVQKMLLVFLLKTQPPITISVYNLFVLSFENFVKIMKTAWSYFMILQQLNVKS